MIITIENLDKLAKEMRQFADEIAAMKAQEIQMEHGPERKKLNKEIRTKQFQALFYMDKIENLAREKRRKNSP